MANQPRYKSIKRDILISVALKQTRIAILEEGKLVEFMVDHQSERRMVGDIYKGVVRRVLPGMQAAFVDIGLPKHGFLHVSDVNYDLFETDYDSEDQGSGGGRRKPRKLQAIQDQLQEGQEIMVQVIKEPISTKGPRVSTDVSLPGRLMVYNPFDNRIGISRKIDDNRQRARIKEIIKKVITRNEGVIVRTAAEDTPEDEFTGEYNSLKNLWRRVKRQSSQVEAPGLVYQEMQLISSLLRDVFNERVDSLIVDSKAEHDRIKDYLKIIAPKLTDRLQLYKGKEPLFTSHNLDDDIRKVFSSKVWLKRGGYIVIEQTEALVSIDVNTGRYTGDKNQEQTILRTNLEAAREIARQIRLRDLGGIIVGDFIDMESRENQQKLLDEFRSLLKFDRSKTKAFDVSPLGLVEMSRQRVRSSLFQSMTEPCPNCDGRGRVYTPEVVTGELEIALRKLTSDGKESELLVKVHPAVALHLMEEEYSLLQQMESHTKTKLRLRDDPLMRLDDFVVFSMPSKKQLNLR